MRNIQAGDLKTSIIIQFDASDGTNYPHWETIAQVLAKKEGLPGRTFYQAAAVQAENDVVYIIRYGTPVKPTMRILDEDNEYFIKSVRDLNNNRQWLEIRAGVKHVG